MSTDREKSRGIREPGFDDSGGVEDDLAVGEGGFKREKVCDVTIDEFKGVFLRREMADIAAAAD